MAIDKRLKIYDEQGNEVDYDILATDVKFLPDGKDLPTKLDELEQEIGEGGYTPPAGGIPKTDLAPSVQTSLDKADTAVQDPNYVHTSNDYTTAEKTKLAGIAEGAEANVQSDWNASSGDAAILNKPTILTQQQVQGMIDEAVEDIEAGETVVIDADGANIVDEHDNNSVLLAPSARQMKLMYENILAIYNGLANIAFTNGKPTLNWIGSKTKYALSYGTLTGCTADVAAGQVDEGGLRIKLTPTQSSYAFTSVLVNDNSVTPVATGDADGSVYVDIIVNQDITLSATAISGYGVSLTSGSHCSISPASVAPNGTYNGTLVADSHYTLPSSISATMGGTSVTFDGTTNSYDSTTGAIKISNVTGAVVITASASLMQSIVVTLDGTNVVFKHGTDTLTGSVTLYEDDKPYTINVKPQSGYSMTAPTATGCTIESDGDDGYNVTIPTTVTSALTISASASMPTSLTLNTKWFQAPATEPTIEAGVPFSLELIPMTNFVAAAAQSAATVPEGYSGWDITHGSRDVRAAVQVLMNNVDITNDAVTFDTTNNKVSINIANPAGAVVINATARIKLQRGKGYTAANNAGNYDACCINTQVISTPNTKTIYYGFGSTGYNVALITEKVAGNTSSGAHYWGAQNTVERLISTTTYPTDINFIATSASLVAINNANETTYPRVKVVDVNDVEHVLISRDDFLNALYY